MSQVARAKKMFDDVSSDEDSKQSGAAVSSPVPATHVDPTVKSPTTSGAADGEARAFAAKSPSTTQPRAERGGGPAVESIDRGDGATDAGDAPGATMVTRVEVSPPPKEVTVSKVAQSETLAASSTARTAKAASGATPAKPPAASSYSTPATVSKRPAERREGEAAAAVAMEQRTASTTKRGSHYQEREAPQDVAAFGAAANRNGGRRHREEYEVESAAYTPASVRKETAAQLDYSREDGGHQTVGEDRTALLRRHTSADTDDESEVEDFPFSTYIFPRMDPALADYQGSRTAVGAAKRGEELPPNACERSLAYLMVTDLRMAVYIGVLFLSIVFVTVSIPTSQLDMTGKACYTYWGYKGDCDSATYTLTRPLVACAETRSRLGAGAAFSIITLLLYVVTFATVIIVVCCLKSAPHTISRTSRVVVTALGAVTAFTQLISWAVIAGIQTAHYCTVAGETTYGVGFGLNLISWILNVLGVVIVAAVPSRFVNRHQRR